MPLFPNAQTWFTKLFTSYSLADPGGAAGGAPPQQDKFLSFSHVFAKKCMRWRLVPPNGSAPPQREILDPPLLLAKFTAHCQITCG